MHANIPAWAIVVPPTLAIVLVGLAIAYFCEESEYAVRSYFGFPFIVMLLYVLSHKYNPEQLEYYSTRITVFQSGILTIVGAMALASVLLNDFVFVEYVAYDIAPPAYDLLFWGLCFDAIIGSYTYNKYMKATSYIHHWVYMGLCIMLKNTRYSFNAMYVFAPLFLNEAPTFHLYFGKSYEFLRRNRLNHLLFGVGFFLFRILFHIGYVWYAMTHYRYVREEIATFDNYESYVLAGVMVVSCIAHVAWFIEWLTKFRTFATKHAKTA